MSKVFARFHSRNRALTLLIPLAWATLLCAGPQASAQSAPRPEALIKWRQSAFQVIAWNSGRIKNGLASGDLQEVRVASAALAAVANAGLAGLFPANTSQGKGWRATTARGEVFSEPQKFGALSEEFALESATLARLAAGTDQVAIKEQFAKVAQACKTCHDRYRQTD